jgi:transketolase
MSPCPLEFVGIKDVFGTSGEPGELAEKFALTAPHIAHAAKRAIERKRNIAGRRKNFR